MINRRYLLSSSGAALALAATGRRTLAASGEAAPYAWRNPPFGGGGFVNGMALHPRRPGLVYLRRERGGAYRRDGHDQPWKPLLDHLGGADADLTSVLAIALDPRDPQRVFLACGDSTGEWSRKAAVMASSDGGASWTAHEQPFRLGGAEGGRGSGERLQVDPQDGRVLGRHHGSRRWSRSTAAAAGAYARAGPRRAMRSWSGWRRRTPRACSTCSTSRAGRCW